MTTTYDYDFFVIGAGSGGVRASRIAASHGAKTGIAEEWNMGGTCVNVGCVPKKLFSYAAHFAHDYKDAEGFGWGPASPTHDWKKLVTRKTAEIQRLNGIYDNLLKNAGVEILRGTASIVGEHTIKVGDHTVTADKILIAVGGWPALPDIDGKEHAITSNEVFYLEDFPKHITIVGGGYIAVEFACIFRALGAKVTQLYRGDLFLRGFDTDIRQALADEMHKQDIDLRFNASMPEKIEKKDGSLSVTLADGSVLETDQILYAIGRTPKTNGLGLDNVGIETDKSGAIIVNQDDQTNVKNIFAVGDVTNRVNLTPVALGEGHALADRLYNNNERHISYDNIACAVFSNPPISVVGLTEDEAKAKYGEIKVFTSSFKPMKHTLSRRDEKSVMKLIVDTASDKVVGCHMMGADAPEIMQGIAVAIKAGATKAVFDSTIGIHPTSAEEFVTMRTPRS